MQSRNCNPLHNRPSVFDNCHQKLDNVKGLPTFKSKCLKGSRFNFLCHFDDTMRGWSTVPCSPCPTDRTALRATTLPAIECACAWGATHRGYCAGRSQSGAWALTSYQWGLAWVGRKLGRVQGTHVMPLHWTCRSPGHGCGGPALPPCLGLVGEEATFTGAGLYPRHFPRQGSTPAAPRPICCHR